LISAIDTEPTRAALLRIRRAGYPVVWLAQTRERPSLAGVTVLHSPPQPGADA
jgi:ABC-type sugar transport system substrate-binding protein